MKNVPLSEKKIQVNSFFLISLPLRKTLHCLSRLLRTLQNDPNMEILASSQALKWNIHYLFFYC